MALNFEDAVQQMKAAAAAASAATTPIPTTAIDSIGIIGAGGSRLDGEDKEERKQYEMNIEEDQVDEKEEEEEEEEEEEKESRTLNHPSKLAELDWHPVLTRRLQQLAQCDDLPHILFYGPSGGGKTTRVRAFLCEMFGDMTPQPGQHTVIVESGTGTGTGAGSGAQKEIQVKTLATPSWTEMSPALHGYDDRHVAQHAIIELASTIPLVTPRRPFHVVVMYHLDKMSLAAQNALRHTLEAELIHCRAIFVAESLSAIIEPLLSRCFLLRVPRPQFSQLETFSASLITPASAPKPALPPPLPQPLSSTREPSKPKRQRLAISPSASALASSISSSSSSSSSFSSSSSAAAAAKMTQVLAGSSIMPVPLPFSDEAAVKLIATYSQRDARRAAWTAAAYLTRTELQRPPACIPKWEMKTIKLCTQIIHIAPHTRLVDLRSELRGILREGVPPSHFLHTLLFYLIKATNNENDKFATCLASLAASHVCFFFFFQVVLLFFFYLFFI